MMDIAIAEVRAQAYENHVYMALVNRTGREGKLTFIGHSAVVGPDGTVLAQADEKPQILRADLDLAALREENRDRFAARRPDQYSLLVSTGEEETA
jgi:predicted amidohydrolase